MSESNKVLCIYKGSYFCDLCVHIDCQENPKNKKYKKNKKVKIDGKIRESGKS